MYTLLKENYSYLGYEKNLTILDSDDSSLISCSETVKLLESLIIIGTDVLTDSEMSEEEIDAMYINDEGNEMSDEEFFFEHYDDVLEEDVVDALYAFICDMGIQHEIDLDRIVSFLCARYVIHHYDSSTVTNYLRVTDIKDIVNLFVENINFGSINLAELLGISKSSNNDSLYNSCVSAMMSAI